MARTQTFGATWWGRAWLEALEQRALEDPNRLPRGRTYARQDRVRNLELSPGQLRAQVWGNRTEPYQTSLSLRELDAQVWDEIFDLAMSRASTMAALLAGEVPQELGPYVLPGRGDLGPECSCPDWAEPCKHVAALCYVAADLFDRDPFALLNLRGRGRDGVLTEIRNRRSERLGVELVESSDQPRGADPTTSGAQAYRRAVVPLDRAAPIPSRPGQMLPLTVEPGADAGIDPSELQALVADAAERAWAMLATGADSGLGLPVGADVVRRAASSDDIEAIAEATGLDPDALQAAVRAWKIGGAAGFAVHRSRDEVDAAALEPGRIALGDQARVRASAVSLADVQLRIDADRRWWRFFADDELGWVLVDGPAEDPADLL
jgi:uncharacterized Zn finger protein